MWPSWKSTLLLAQTPTQLPWCLSHQSPPDPPPWRSRCPCLPLSSLFRCFLPPPPPLLLLQHLKFLQRKKTNQRGAVWLGLGRWPVRSSLCPCSRPMTVVYSLFECLHPTQHFLCSGPGTSSICGQYSLQELKSVLQHAWNCWTRRPIEVARGQNSVSISVTDAHQISLQWVFFPGQRPDQQTPTRRAKFLSDDHDRHVTRLTPSNRQLADGNSLLPSCSSLVSSSSSSFCSSSFPPPSSSPSSVSMASTSIASFVAPFISSAPASVLSPFSPSSGFVVFSVLLSLHPMIRFSVSLWHVCCSESGRSDRGCLTEKHMQKQVDTNP